ncbi:hypothetical protein [Nocardioides ochotonae]|uniref:hypothetical protein n=1 Tax=Nocardioides ochotonae TaxID=2685869 RepID=UPI00140A44CD|nr:hypothetical protein [Nocardioides ochotonae]
MSTTTGTPTIVCPAWCTVPQDEHRDELAGLDGHVTHWSSPVGLSPVMRNATHLDIRLAQTTLPDGTPAKGEAWLDGAAVLHVDDTDYSLTSARVAMNTLRCLINATEAA